MRVMKTPRSVDILFTSKCNLSCSYCSDFSSNPVEDVLIGEWLEFVEELGRNSVLSVGIGGGEPFIRDDLRALIDCIVENRMRFTMVSNGSLISDSMAKHIASTGRCDTVQVSIDGSHSRPHDVFRGKGSFAGAIRGLECLRRNGIPVAVRVTIHRQNVSDLERIGQFLIEELGLPGFSSNAASHLGSCRVNSEEVQLKVEDRMNAMMSLMRLRKKYGNGVQAAAGPLSEARQWIRMERSRLAGEASTSDLGFLSSCGGVFSKLAVKSNGVMIPCSQMPHIELGRINQTCLKETWQNHPELIKLRKRTQLPLRAFEFCRDCQYTSYCRGNCPALAYTITGLENHPSPDACLRDFRDSGGDITELIRYAEKECCSI